MNQALPFGARDQMDTVRISKLLRNTYLLLGLSLMAGAIGAYVGRNMPIINWWLYLGFAVAMPFVINATRNSVMGLVSTFVYTTGLGLIAGPIISMYATRIGIHVPIYAFATTAVVFFALSAYVITTGANFQFMGSAITVGCVVVLLAFVANMFLQISWFSVGIASIGVVLSAALILWRTSSAVHGGEDNYITLAAGIYGDLWAMFMNLMNIIGFMSDD